MEIEGSPLSQGLGYKEKKLEGKSLLVCASPMANKILKNAATFFSLVCSSLAFLGSFLLVCRLASGTHIPESAPIKTSNHSCLCVKKFPGNFISQLNVIPAGSGNLFVLKFHQFTNIKRKCCCKTGVC